MKKKYIILPFTLLFLLFLSSCFERKCDCYADYPPNAILETYFSNYRYGSQSWVYVNRDRTKRDSVFLTWNPKESGRGIIMDETNCITEYWWSTILNSKYLSNDTIRSSYSSNSLRLSTKWDYNFWFYFRSEVDMDTLLIFAGDESCPLKTEDLILPIGVSYKEVLNIKNRLWFAPNVGLVKYVSFIVYNKPDTFYLQKFYQK